MRVHLLATGGALTGARRGNTSLAVTSTSHSLLIDCSGNPAQLLERAGVEWTSLEAVLLTHRHPDHLYGLPSLVLSLFLATRESGRPPLRLLGPPTALEAARKLLEAVELLDEPDLIELHFEPLPLERHRAEVGDLQLETFPVVHRDLEALGLKVEPAGEPGRALVHSGDTELCDAVVEASADAALVTHECSVLEAGERVEGHTSIDQIDELAARSNAAKIALVHLPPIAPIAEGRLRRGLKQRHGGRVIIADDGDRLEL